MNHVYVVLLSDSPDGTGPDWTHDELFVLNCCLWTLNICIMSFVDIVDLNICIMLFVNIMFSII